ncbi:MAG: Smr/MutS family protein, partial [SAR202 cluster bacterium]|nr:Smr/MutS family protein [SAR202 cluster bacterium]
EPAPVPRRERVEERPIGVGDTVFVRGLNLEGKVAELATSSNEAEIAIGNVRINVDRNRLSRVETEPVAPKTEAAPPLRASQPSEARELDLRGIRAEEALSQVETFLDRAMLDDIPSARIIHGRGTGALREAVREHLNRHPLVEAYGPEPRERGGNGATWVTMN